MSLVHRRRLMGGSWSHRHLLAIAWISATLLVPGPATAAEPEPVATARELDRILAAETSVDSETSASQVDDTTFLRRVFLDLVGETPTPDDVLAFAFLDEESKRRDIVDQLLNDDAFGVNWARYWRDVIMYRRSEERALIAVNSMTEYLTDRLNQNTSWDEIATDFITATGDVRENGDAALIPRSLWLKLGCPKM